MKVAENNDATPPVVTALERAEYARVSYCIDGEGFETGDNHIEVYWEEVSGQ